MIELEFEDIKNIFGPKTESLFIDNLKTVVARELGTRLIEIIMEKFDEFSNAFETIYGKAEEDPTHPAKWREELQNKLINELEENIIVEDNKITLELGEKEFLGYDNPAAKDPKSSEPIVWLVYYLEGLVGEYAFIDDTTFRNKPKKRGREEDIIQYGRFGEGFLIPMDDFFSERWNEIVSFEEAKFPNAVPDDFFEKAAEAFSEEAGQILENQAIKAFIAALNNKRL